MKPQISVIIPIYNTGKSAVKLIQSLQHDPYQNLEIIAVDDGSTDDSLALLKKLKYKNLRIFHRPTASGSGSAPRNLGLKKAKGEYIAFLDSDDEISPEFLSSLAHELSDLSVTLAVTGFRYKRLHQGITKDVYLNMLEPRQQEESYKCYILRLLATDGRLYSSVNKLYRAETIKKHHLQFDETLDFAEDTKFVLDYLDAETGDIRFVLKPYYIYNYGTDTSTVASSALLWKNWQISYVNLEAWLGPHPTASEKHQLSRVHFRWQISHALAVARSKKSFREKCHYLNPLLLPPFLILAKLRK